MDIKIKHKQLETIFNSIMTEFKDLERADKSYDYYVSEKNICWFRCLQLLRKCWGWFEDDEWALQYHPTGNDYTEENESPALYYAEWFFRNVINVFGVENFKQLLRPWFEKNYGLPVNIIDKERS